jgi:hypothetical protein
MAIVADLGEAVRAKLNDTGSQLYNDAVLLPHFQSAWMILQSKMRSNGIPVTRDSGVVITIPAGGKGLSFASIAPYPTLPPDLINIIEVHEKGPTEDDSFYVRMDDYTFLPDIPVGQNLRYYAWAEGRLEFLGATEDRMIRIRYLKYLQEITSSNSSITVPGTEDFLIHKVGALAARYIGQNATRANELEMEAVRARDDFMNTEAKGKQGDPVQRRPYGFTRRQYRWRTR